MKIWILVLVVCAGVEQKCEPVNEVPLEYKTYVECTEAAYQESYNLLFEGDITLDDVDSKRLFTKWSCIPVLKREAIRT
jgi:hypothetical protein